MTYFRAFFTLLLLMLCPMYGQGQVINQYYFPSNVVGIVTGGAGLTTENAVACVASSGVLDECGGLKFNGTTSTLASGNDIAGYDTYSPALFLKKTATSATSIPEVIEMYMDFQLVGGENTNKTVYGVYNTVNMGGSGHLGGGYSTYGETFISDSVDADSVYGYLQNVSLWGTAHVDNVFAFNANVYMAEAGASATNVYQVYVNAPGATGTITNAYGVYLEAQAGGDTLNYNIFSAGSAGTGTNYFGGPVLVDSQKATTGQRYVCIDTTGKLVSSASACSGT